MIFNILKRDLKRKKTTNIVLLLFIVMAATFVASSVSNIVTVMNGTDYYFDKAGLGDYVVLTMGENSVGSLDSVLKNNRNVDEYRIENVVYASEDKFRANGEKMELSNVILLQSLSAAKQKFFDKNNEEVNDVERGKVYLTSNCMEKNHLKVGDKIRIHYETVDITLEIAGKLKDALFGSVFMGNTRFLMNEMDYQQFLDNEVILQSYRGQICYIDTSNEKALASQLGDVDHISFDANRAMFRMCYVMDMVLAGVLLVLSVCLIIVSFVVLKFTINFTLTEEFREIGVMKAIGISNGKIRNIYVVKYFAIAIAGAIIGFLGSIPFSDFLIRSVGENMVLGNDFGIGMNIGSALLVVVVIVLYAHLCTRKVKKCSPIDAIRSGQTGERYRKKSVYQLGKSHISTSGYLSWNDVLSSPKRYLTIIIAFCICCLLVFMIANTSETLQSENLSSTFSKPSDMYITDVNKNMTAMCGEGKEKLQEVIDEYEQTLRENDMPVKVNVDVQYKYCVKFDNNSYKLTCQQGVNTKMTDYEYYGGTAPQNIHEIAITEQIADKIGAKLGDTVQIVIGEKTDDYIITAYFQSMNQLGEIVRLHEDVDTSMKDSVSIMAFQFDFLDHPTKQQIDERVEKTKKIFDNDKVFNRSEFTKDCVGVVDTMKGVEFLLLGITMIVVVLVTILMERSFISDEKKEIAILKAIGFSNRSIVVWHIKRFCIVTFIAIVLALILAVPMTKLCITPVFNMMGMKSVSFDYNLINLFVIYPIVILIVTLLSATLTSLFVKKIKSSDTASIE